MSDRAGGVLSGAFDAEEIAALYDSAPVGLCVLDRELRYVRINDRLAAMNGLPARDHIGKTVREMVPGLADQAEALMRRVLAGETVRGADISGTMLSQPDIPRRQCENWTPLRDADGAIIGASVSVEELTDEKQATEALRKGEERLRFGLEAARMVAWDFDLTTGQSRRSANARALFGLDPYGTDDFYRLVHPDDLDRLKAAQAKAVAGEADYDVEFRLNMPDDSIRWVAVRGRLRHDEHGNPSALAGVLMDITARKEAEIAAERSAAEFEALAENVSQLAWMAGPDGAIFWYNRRWFEYTGTTADEMLGWGWSKVHHPDHLERVTAKWHHHLARGEPWEDTFPLRGADGAYRWFLSRAEPIHDKDGAIIRWFGTNTDVTEQIETAEALARSEAQFRAMLDALPGMIFLANPADGHLQVNEGFRTYTGRSSEELGGYRWIEVLHPDDQARGREIWNGAVRAQNIYMAEHRFRRSDGAYRWHIVRALPVRDEAGRVTSWVGACVDIHERKVAEEELHRRVAEAVAERETALFQLHEAQKLETVGQLTGGVAHDFNNLLTPIVGSLDLLRRRAEDERSIRLIDGALASAERARTLIQRLLAFARRQTLQPRAVDPRALVDGMRDLVERSLGPRISFETEIETEVPPALIDPNQLELALLNLAINARDAMPSGGKLRLRIAEDRAAGTRADLMPGRYIRLSVSDTGVGMNAETLARAVEPFFSTKPAGKGTGLGLSMVHGLAAQSGGAFRLESAVGEGTTATLWLPVADEAVAAAPSISDARTASRRAVVLLVDDEDEVRFTTGESLTELGYDVVDVESAQAALDRVAAGLMPDLLVTDQLMPGMTGAQLAMALRDRLPDLPVLMITGYAQLRPEELGGFDVLIKPYRHAELALRIAELLAEQPVANAHSADFAHDAP